MAPEAANLSAVGGAFSGDSGLRVRFPAAQALGQDHGGHRKKDPQIPVLYADAALFGCAAVVDRDLDNPETATQSFNDHFRRKSGA